VLEVNLFVDNVAFCDTRCAAYGEVFKGEWRGNVVAIKKVKVGLSNNEIEDFRKESAVMMKMRFVIVLFTFNSHSFIQTSWVQISRKFH
jgi:hypothetical protein